MAVAPAGKGAMDYTETEVAVKWSWTGESLLSNMVTGCAQRHTVAFSICSPSF